MEILFGLVEKDIHKAQSDVRRVQHRLLTTQALIELASTPLSCTTLVQVYKYSKKDLPQKRVDVFQEVVDLLLGFWKAQEGIARPEELVSQEYYGKTYTDLLSAVTATRKRLCRLAAVMQESGKAEIESAEGDPNPGGRLERERPKPRT